MVCRSISEESDDRFDASKQLSENDKDGGGHDAKMAKQVGVGD